MQTKEDTISTFFPCPKPKKLFAKKVSIVASGSDKWCSVNEAEELATTYGASFKVLPNAGHINDESGYGSWAWIEEEFRLKRECIE